MKFELSSFFFDMKCSYISSMKFEWLRPIKLQCILVLLPCALCFIKNLPQWSTAVTYYLQSVEQLQVTNFPNSTNLFRIYLNFRISPTSKINFHVHLISTFTWSQMWNSFKFTQSDTCVKIQILFKYLVWQV